MDIAFFVIFVEERTYSAAKGDVPSVTYRSKIAGRLNCEARMATQVHHRTDVVTYFALPSCSLYFACQLPQLGHALLFLLS